MERGLFRSVLFEAVFFVPASVILVYAAIRPFVMLVPAVGTWSHKSDEMDTAVHAMFGIVSYGFPFLTVRRIVVALALGPIREFGRLRTQDHVRARSAKSTGRIITGGTGLRAHFRL